MSQSKNAAEQKNTVEAVTGVGRYADLSRVALRVAKHVDEGDLPAGSQGTVVGVYSDGAGYEVEFVQPISAVVTLNANELMPCL